MGRTIEGVPGERLGRSDELALNDLLVPMRERGAAQRSAERNAIAGSHSEGAPVPKPESAGAALAEAAGGNASSARSAAATCPRETRSEYRETSVAAEAAGGDGESSAPECTARHDEPARPGETTPPHRESSAAPKATGRH